jgi:hypothetical protein
MGQLSISVVNTTSCDYYIDISAMYDCRGNASSVLSDNGISLVSAGTTVVFTFDPNFHPDCVLFPYLKSSQRVYFYDSNNNLLCHLNYHPQFIFELCQPSLFCGNITFMEMTDFSFEYTIY